MSVSSFSRKSLFIRLAGMRKEPLKLGRSANKLVATNAAENLTSVIVAVVVHEARA